MGTGQNSPTLSPVSPASTSTMPFPTHHHHRSASVSSITPIMRSSRGDHHMPQSRSSHASQSSTGGPNSPGPHSPASPGPGLQAFEPSSPRPPPTPPPPRPPLPPRRRDSPEISSPQVKLRGHKFINNILKFSEIFLNRLVKTSNFYHFWFFYY